MEQAIIYTDGSCGKNKDGGWACLISIKHHDFSTSEIEIAGWEENTTNNRMEMIAAIRGLEYLKEPTQVYLASDSAYMLNTLKHKWYEDWFRYDKARKNVDLWKVLVKLTEQHIIKTIKVKGHSDDLVNVRVDKMAVQARLDKVSYTNVISPNS